VARKIRTSGIGAEIQDATLYSIEDGVSARRWEICASEDPKETQKNLPVLLAGLFLL